MAKRDIVVLGGSAGGIKALLSLVRNLSPSFSSTIFVVIHTSPDSPGLLPEILSEPSPIPVQHAVSDEPFAPGTIYIAPPDRHLLVDADGHMRLTFGPKENRFRPAIDPLFRSAALAFGPRVVGVLLSGGLDDGVAGLAAIKKAGGITIVQDPDEAEVRSMPENALRQVAIDHRARVSNIGALLEELSSADIEQSAALEEIRKMSRKELEIEVRLAHEREGLRSDLMELGGPSMLTCPECHGALIRLKDETVLRYRCHTGHAFSAQSLMAALTEHVEESLWTAVSAVEESAMLLGHMANHAANGDAALANQFRQASKDALRRAKAVRSIISQTRDMPAGEANKPAAE